jgi:hypothetical protein
MHPPPDTRAPLRASARHSLRTCTGLSTRRRRRRRALSARVHRVAPRAPEDARSHRAASPPHGAPTPQTRPPPPRVCRVGCPPVGGRRGAGPSIAASLAAVGPTPAPRRPRSREAAPARAAHRGAQRRAAAPKAYVHARQARRAAAQTSTAPPRSVDQPRAVRSQGVRRAALWPARVPRRAGRRRSERRRRRESRQRVAAHAAWVVSCAARCHSSRRWVRAHTCAGRGAAWARPMRGALAVPRPRRDCAQRKRA